MTLCGGFSRQHVVFKVSLVSDVPSGEVSGHHKGGAVGCCGLSDTQLLGALPHHGCEMTWGRALMGGVGGWVSVGGVGRKIDSDQSLRSELRSPTDYHQSAGTICFTSAQLLNVDQCESLWCDSLTHLELWVKWLLGTEKWCREQLCACYFEAANDDHPKPHIERGLIWSRLGQNINLYEK